MSEVVEKRRAGRPCLYPWPDMKVGEKVTLHDGVSTRGSLHYHRRKHRDQTFVYELDGRDIVVERRT